MKLNTDQTLIAVLFIATLLILAATILTALERPVPPELLTPLGLLIAFALGQRTANGKGPPDAP